VPIFHGGVSTVDDMDAAMVGIAVSKGHLRGCVPVLPSGGDVESCGEIEWW
jgi:hypothetical protein